MELSKNINWEYSVSKYDPTWVNQFETIKKFLVEVFGEKAVKIEHVGSTSIVGMSAKPVIDILIIIEKIENFTREKEEMMRSGYEWSENYIAPDTIFFFKHNGKNKRLVNIHVCEKGAPKVRQFLTMRDFLRTHQNKAKEYSDLKEKSSKTYSGDYLSYRKAKTPFLEDLEQEAYQWAESK